MGELLFLPPPKELSPQQREHWEQTLETAERLRENALRVLGRLPLERGLDGTQFNMDSPEQHHDPDTPPAA